MKNHIPVLAKEIGEHLTPGPGTCLLDLTLGLGGHSEQYLQGHPESHVVGLDADQQALSRATERLTPFADRTQFIHSNFAHLNAALEQAGIDKPFDHILLDLGVGSHQLDAPDRGFSFQATSPLKMAYGQQEGLPAADIEALNALQRRLGHFPEADELVEYLKADDLAVVIRHYGEERYSYRIAQRIKKHAADIHTAADLANIITDAVPGAYKHGRIHPATRTFQALRLAVNRELEALKSVLPQAFNHLAPGGYMAVISFHSLEDRLVKQFFRYHARKCICPQEQPICTCSRQPNLAIITNKPIRPSEAECTFNSRSRSAKLRVAQKTP